MKKRMMKAMAISLAAIFLFGGCASAEENLSAAAITTTDPVVQVTEVSTAVSVTDNSSGNILSAVDGSVLDTTEMFTDRDLEQTADLSNAAYLEVESGSDLTISEEGVYVVTGKAEDATIVVEADDEAKVQIVLDGVSITNTDTPAIYVKSADKVFVTTTDSDNALEVTGYYTADGTNNLDAVIYSKSDLVLNGTGMLEIVSVKGNGIASKDDLKVTGGAYVITSEADGLEANDSIRIYDGEISIVSNKDALHSENDEDASLGYIYIYGGVLNITAVDDAIRGTSIVQIDGGTINIETCTEGIEGTTIQINGGEIDIYALDDGINAAAKSPLSVLIEVNGGTINVKVASGDTDAFDSNGNITINGGTINAEGNSIFDADGSAVLNGGEVTANGQIITEITQMQMMGGGGGRHRK